jgi:mannosyltransferase OCH1-like enzyme
MKQLSKIISKLKSLSKKNKTTKNVIFIIIIIIILLIGLWLLYKWYIVKHSIFNIDFFSSNIISNDNRVKYYLKNIYNEQIHIDITLFNGLNYIHTTANTSQNEQTVDKNKTIPFNSKIYKLTYNQLTQSFKSSETNPHFLDDIPVNEYRKSLRNALSNSIDDKQKQQSMLYSPGDNYKITKYHGIITKSRNINDPYSVLLKINTVRHWKPIKDVVKYDMPYEQKDNKIIWRGCTTGVKQHNKRFQLVEQYFDHDNENIDIGFSHIVQNEYQYQDYVKDKLTMKDMLKSKFLISIEGNDVASGLKWQMASNSLVFMSKPKTASWFMEDMLIPDVHYILLNDEFSNLEEKYTWAIEHPNKCKHIIKNANEYVMQFMNEKNEHDIVKKMMNIYFKNVRFSTNNNNIIEKFSNNGLKANANDIMMTQIYENNMSNVDKHIIPKVLYKTGVEKHNNLSPQMLELFKKIKNDNPDIKIVYFDNDECRDFILKHFGNNVLQAFDALLPGSYKADLFRYCILYINGGIYGDLTQTYNYPFNRIIDYTKEMCLTRDRVFGHKDFGIQISFIASKPRLNIYKCAIKSVIDNINNNYYGLTSIDPTGPRLFKLCYNKEKDNINHQMIIEERGGKITFIDEPKLTVIINKLPDVDKILKRNYKMRYPSQWKNKNIYVKNKPYISNIITCSF